MKKTLLIIGLFCSTFFCFSQISDFNSFLKNFHEMKFPYIVDNQSSVNEKDYIPNKGMKREVFLKYLNEIKEYTSKESYFYYGRKFQYRNFNILTYQITYFGDAPALDTIKVELVVFDSQWKMLSKMVIGGQETEDKLINCVLNQDMTFVVSILNSSNKLIRKQKYFIDVDGKIKKTVIN